MNKVVFPKNMSKEQKLILSDPQTSGGLLISLSKKGLKKFNRIARKKGLKYWIIGKTAKGKGRIIVK